MFIGWNEKCTFYNSRRDAKAFLNGRNKIFPRESNFCRGVNGFGVCLIIIILLIEKSEI